MVIEWDAHMTAVFSDEKIEQIASFLRGEPWYDETAIDMVEAEVCGFDDCEYYAWNREQTMKVVNEIKKRVGGIQLSMFDEGLT